MSEWKEYKLEDVCDAIYSGGTPSSMVKDYWNGSLPWLSSGETNQRYIFSTEKCITQEGVDNSSTRYAYKDSTVVASAGQGHTRGQASLLCINTYVNQSVIVLKPNEKCLNPYFLYYNIDNRYNELRQLSDGTSTRGSLSGKILKELPIKIPSLVIQSKIASILKSFDDKIEVNKRISDNLEQQAQALFKHWFVDFAPFKDGKFVESELGLIPEGWRVCTLGEICKCELGGTPSRAKKSYWGGNIAWINSGEVNKFRICEASEFITEDGLNHSATKLLPAKTTVLAITGATLGQVSLLEIDSCANQSVVGVKENEKIPYTFIYPAIKCNINKLINMQTGGAQQHINKDNIQSLQIIEAPKNIMEEYKLLTLPLYEEIGILCFENLRLATLRDTLLPKLMSGELSLE